MKIMKTKPRGTTMDIFVSHKQVTATPMNRLDYNVYRGWALPADENGADEGYLVEYLDGGKPNHPDHKGYISWSPKEQFDNGYTKVPETFLDRLVVEVKELGGKIGRLRQFIESDRYDLLSLSQRSLLLRQRDAMIEYHNVLDERIELL